MPATPPPPPGGSADRIRSCWFGGCTASVTGPLRPVLPACKRLECTAVRLLRQGLAARRAPAGPPPSSGCQRGQDGVSGGPRCCRTMVAGPVRAGGQAMYTRAGRGCWRGLAGSAGAACPPTPRRSLRSVVVRTVFYCRAVCCRAPGAGRVLLPLTASRGGGSHRCGQPLAAAGGCRLLRRFFFLLKRRKVIPAGPRQGQASLCSVRQRTLDMALSARIGDAREGGRKRKMPQQPAAFAARGRTACFTPRRHSRNGRSGGSTGTRRCTAAAHNPQNNSWEEGDYSIFAGFWYGSRGAFIV
jgi:hypothetical protein